MGVRSIPDSSGGVDYPRQDGPAIHADSHRSGFFFLAMFLRQGSDIRLPFGDVSRMVRAIYVFRFGGHVRQTVATAQSLHSGPGPLPAQPPAPGVWSLSEGGRLRGGGGYQEHETNGVSYGFLSPKRVDHLQDMWFW